MAFNFISGSVESQGALTASLSITAGSEFVIGSAAIGEAELEILDGATISTTELNYLNITSLGTVDASAVVTADANKDIGTIRNLTIDGTFSDGNYTFDTSGNVTSLGTVGCGAITSTGAGSFVGTLTADTSLTLDAVTITTAEIGVLDGVTAGAGLASKALVLDANADLASGLRSLTASANLYAAYFQGNGSLLTNVSTSTMDVTTQASSTDTFYIPFVDTSTGGTGETVYIDDIISLVPSTNGFTASAGVKVGGSLTIGNSGEIGCVADIDLLTLASTTVTLASDATLQFADSGETIKRSADGYLDLLAGTMINLSGAVRTTSTVHGGGAVTATGLVSGSLGLRGLDIVIAPGKNIGVIGDTNLLTLEANQIDLAGVLSSSLGLTGSSIAIGAGNDTWGVSQHGQMYHASWAEIAPTINADKFLIYDADTGNVKVEEIKDLVDSVCGTAADTGLAGNSDGTMSLDIDSLTTETIATGDTFAFNDSGDDGLHSVTLDALATKLAGAGLAAASGVLSTDAAAVTALSDTAATLVLAEGYNIYPQDTDLTRNVTLSLPAEASPSTGDTIHVKMGPMGGYRVRITNSSSSGSIDGHSAYVDYESDYTGITYVRNGTTGNWIQL